MSVIKNLKGIYACVILALLLTTSCESDQVLPPKIEEEVSFANDMQPYFDSQCIACHNGTGIPLNLLVDVAYDEIIGGNYVDSLDASASVLYVKILPGGSMESYASETQRAMTLAWIEQGAKNN